MTDDSTSIFRATRGTAFVEDKPLEAGIFDKMVEALLGKKGFALQKSPDDGKRLLTAYWKDRVAAKTQNGHEIKSAVECLISDVPSGEDIVQSFIGRMGRDNLDRGILISYRGFTPKAEETAKSHDIELWDYGYIAANLFTATGDLAGKDIALDINVLYPEAISIRLLNKEAVSVTRATLYYYPYLVCAYSLHHEFMDRQGRKHLLIESGRAVFDGITFETLRNDDPKMSESKAKALEEVMRHDDAGETTSRPERTTSKYTVIRAAPSFTMDKARASARKKLSQHFRRHVAIPDPDENGMMLIDVKPSPKDVEAGEAYFVYIPIWEIELQCKDKTFIRKILANSGKVLSDRVYECALCGGHAAIAVCESCGRPSCKDHVHKCAECDTYLCEEHVNTCLNCGRHFCDTHARKECNISERYSSLVGLKKMPNMGLLRIIGIVFLIGAGIFAASTVLDTGGGIIDGLMTLLFFGGPLSALTFSILIFGVVLVSLNYGKKRRKKITGDIPVLYHKLAKKSP